MSILYSAVDCSAFNIRVTSDGVIFNSFAILTLEPVPASHRNLDIFLICLLFNFMQQIYYINLNLNVKFFAKNLYKIKHIDYQSIKIICIKFNIFAIDK